MKKFIIEKWNDILTGILAVIVILGGTIKSFFIRFDAHEGVAIIVGAIITGLITWMAMWFIDNENKKRWKRDSLQKKKTDIILEALSATLDVRDMLNTIVDNFKQSRTVKWEEKYLSNIQSLNTIAKKLDVIAFVEPEMKSNLQEIEEFYLLVSNVLEKIFIVIEEKTKEHNPDTLNLSIKSLKYSFKYMDNKGLEKEFLVNEANFIDKMEKYVQELDRLDIILAKYFD